jgi:hypothetical protein
MLAQRTDGARFLGYILWEKHASLAYSKIIYELGNAMLSSDPRGAKEFWNTSILLSPQWSHFYIELAAIDYFVFSDAGEARKKLVKCMEYASASRHCGEYVSALFLLPPPGSLLPAVQTFKTHE